MEEFYEFLSNENSRNTFSTLMNKMNEYERMVNKKFNELADDIPYPKHADYWVSNINYLNKPHQT